MIINQGVSLKCLQCDTATSGEKCIKLSSPNAVKCPENSSCFIKMSFTERGLTYKKDILLILKNFHLIFFYRKSKFIVSWMYNDKRS